MRYSRLAYILAPLLLINARANAQNRNAPSLPEESAQEDEPEEDLGTQIEDLRDRLRQAEEAQAKNVNPLSINGYVDFGFFDPLGNHGIGWVRDNANRQFPQYSGYSWSFLGDILGSPVNSRGEAADLGDAPGVTRFDSVNSGGAPGFIANEFNLRVGYQLAEKVLLRTSVNFVPRSPKGDFQLGDFFDADLAEMEYVVTDDGNTSIFVGKMLPVFGIEYKERKSDQRFDVVPTLVHRYTSESQLGLKVRSKLLHDFLIVAASVTNNSSSTEQFHFHNEIDRNSGKFLNGRLALNLPVNKLGGFFEGHTLELGGSGEWGPQDWATDNSGKMWFAGADLQYKTANFALKGQWIIGKAPGSNAARVWKLDLHSSGYVEADYMVLPWLGLMLRANLRNADVFLQMERAYITRVMRFDAAVRIVFNPHIVLKAEYYNNHEFDMAQIKNDMFTSSLVMSF
jgi:hypothetical protein